MKKAFILVLSLVMVFALGACSNNSTSSPSSTTSTAPQSSVVSDNPSTPDVLSSSQSKDDAEENISSESVPEDVGAADSAASDAPNMESTSNASDASSGSNILVAYFTVPESDGVDAVARASRVVVDGKVVGNTQFIAGVIQGATGGDLFEIKTVWGYIPPAPNSWIWPIMNKGKTQDRSYQLR